MTRREFLKKLGLITGAAVAGPLLSGLFSSLVTFTKPPKTMRNFAMSKNPQIREALFWKPECSGVRCTLCPHLCFLSEGERGKCHVRMNQGNQLVTLVYGQPCSVHVDPIEKKPVFHMLPGTGIFSIATTGCNLRCQFCQNWEISQTFPEETRGMRLEPKDVVAKTIEAGCKSIAYTYSEPTIFYEYVYDTARLAKEKGLRNVMVSAGYINPEPLKALAPFMDVVKIDLKGFNESFYKNVVGGELKFVQRTLVLLKKYGILTEIVNLVVPTMNDDLKEIRKMILWIKSELGPDVPLFFSRFHPQFKLQNLPPTPLETLRRAREMAMDEGLHYVYTGNVPGDGGENTYCPTCKKPLIERYGFAVTANRLTSDGRCPYDGTVIPGIWR